MKSYKAYAKVNIFLKVTGKRGDYHEILSRFVLVNNLYDTLTFVPKENDDFVIYGDFNCETAQNTIYKAFKALLEATKSERLKRLMQSHAVKVAKKIPSFAGLGGGSSDAATYLLMCNEVLHLGLSRDELAVIGAKVGADVPFFVYDYQSANVSGIGEIVEAFDEPPLNIKTITPKIEISTPKVYQAFREQFYKELSIDEQIRLSHISSLDALEEMTPEEANDLFEPALLLYPKLEQQHEKGWFFSGSGSSFFTVAKG
ncbi:MAG: 4-(cytidine 5'-diphospho)-2-C-methyl-D-erythritol kinase [Helicobacteraceae bacterium]|jgi:4-diphosphocytidyl-2-C-methyl-D-erythritol kinase|nr:4-(cytidine 5'-diphospho)-2-C-methyl-D-erythritol kinase [Helicobacteraceae bacterium]